ncbi:hypothetical protein N5K35_30900 [Pseudomonas sp. GD03651]|uniref:hypothetical protein n=1 Tax=Pseudomonas TaxID=286 RepID=UPI00034EF65C|nr:MULTISPECIES: hypothetical protein [Pseudomonas]AGN82033.1 hypothetical protein L483_13275 [Pseudomonas putida H8234]MDH2188084.1 hypothetical protein [Pseudomonas sp. GD03651]HDS1815120.1 hypothetical protein [Pseudomonas putida]HDS3812170.1 hypothetical protein [Pseudomonas putida]
MSDIEHYVTYEPDGRIHGVLSCPPGAAQGILRLNTSLPALQVSAPVSADQHYVANGQVVKRPDIPAVLEGMWLKGVPAGAALGIEGQIYMADGSEIELEFSHPGRFMITISKWPYKDQEVTVEITA